MEQTVKADHKRANYVLAILFVVMMLNFVDRQIITILAESIKRDMSLSDKQIGLMTGLSFAIFYTTLSIPIAILADRWNRSRIIAISIAIWSIMTMLSGVASNFIQLFFARVGVGIGEAGSSPASHSLIADLFPPERRATALGILGIAVHVGAFIAYTGGGWMAEHVGWRLAIFIAGVPGVIIAAMIWFTVPDPKRKTSLRDAFKPKVGEVTLKQAVKELSLKPAYWHLVAAGTAISFVAYGMGTFYPGFFVRVHEVGYEELGLKLGIMMLVFGALGSWIGGRLGAFMNSKISGGSLLITAFILLLSVPGVFMAMYVDNFNVAILCLGVPTFGFAFMYSPCFASMQLLASDRTRALAMSIWLFFSSLIGLGLGPVMVGALSDYFAAGNPAAEGLGVQRAIAVTSILSVWGAFHYWRAQANLKKDIVEAPNKHS